MRVGHRQNPSWCFAVRISARAPALRAERAHCRASRADGEKIGTVKAVHGTDFVLNRPMGRDLFVPFSAVRTVDGERVMLGIRASEVDDQHWPNPELTGSNTEGAASR